jgi:2'-5' RNA ligase
MKRVFFGISLPSKIQRKIYELATDLAIPKARITPAENLHLTLRFIGNANDEQIEFFKRRLEKACKKFKPFEIRLGEVGAFSSIKKARVVWIGISVGGEQIKELAWETEKAARKLGFKEEKRFHPHITFARSKFPLDIINHVESLEEEAKKLFGKSVKVKKITLFESKLSSSAAEYLVLHEFTLAG